MDSLAFLEPALSTLRNRIGGLWFVEVLFRSRSTTSASPGIDEPMAELAGRADENAAARADEREALSAIFDGISLNDERVEAPLDLDTGADDAKLFEPGDKAVLRFTLPPSYPLDAPATATISWATAYRVPASIKDHVEAAVAAALASTSGDAAIFSAVAAANDALNEEAERHAAAYASWRSAARTMSFSSIFRRA